MHLFERSFLKCFFFVRNSFSNYFHQQVTTYKQSTKRYGKRKRIFYKKNVNNEDDDETNNVNNQKTQPSTPTRVTTPTAAATESETVSQKKIK